MMSVIRMESGVHEIPAEFHMARRHCLTDMVICPLFTEGMFLEEYCGGGQPQPNTLKNKTSLSTIRAHIGNSLLPMFQSSNS